jgi:hypothetical protein
MKTILLVMFCASLIAAQIKTRNCELHRFDAADTGYVYSGLMKSWTDTYNDGMETKTDAIAVISTGTAEYIVLSTFSQHTAMHPGLREDTLINITSKEEFYLGRYGIPWCGTGLFLNGYSYAATDSGLWYSYLDLFTYFDGDTSRIIYYSQPTRPPAGILCEFNDKYLFAFYTNGSDDEWYAYRLVDLSDPPNVTPDPEPLFYSDVNTPYLRAARITDDLILTSGEYSSNLELQQITDSGVTLIEEIVPYIPTKWKYQKDSLFVFKSTYGPYFERQIYLYTLNWNDTSFVFDSYLTPPLDFHSTVDDDFNTAVEISGDTAIVYSLLSGEISAFSLSGYGLLDSEIFIGSNSIFFQRKDTYTGVDDFTADIPETFTLHPAFPNPFNPSTTISFTLPENARVKLTIYDINGREIDELENSDLHTGSYVYQWDGKNKRGEFAASGIYFCRLSAAGNSGKSFVKTIKLLMVK